MAVPAIITGLARVGSSAARAGGAAAKTGAKRGIETGAQAAMTQMTYGALSHVAGQPEPPKKPADTYDRFPGY